MSACASCGGPSEEGARYCSRCGAPLAGADPAAARARKVVTVLFSDVRGFTALGERLDPESLHQVMRRWFDGADEAIRRHGGMVEKHIGDAVMAVFGVPVAHEDDALRAARAALDMREGLDGLNHELGRRWDVRLTVRTGINTGEVVVADDPQGQPSILGDAVNVAQRLEAAAEPGQVLIGEPTARLVRGVARLDRFVELAVKGKTAPVRARRLVALESGAAEVPSRAWTPLVGRGHELGLLRRTFDEAVDQRTPRLATVLGPAGIGKSRLVRALLDDIGDEATTAVGRCLPYGEAITYWPLVEIARELAGSADEPGLAELLEDGHAPVEETQMATRRLLEATARRRPLVVIVEDIHWAAPTLLDLIEHLAEFANAAPLLLVCLARPELLDGRPAWATVCGGRASTVRLEPLSAREASELLGTLGGSELTTAEREALLTTAEGNPFFLQQMVANRSETQDGPIAASPTIGAVLTARIDRLAPAERAVLEHGSIEGRTFHRGVLVDLLADQRGDDLDANLAALARRELIRPARPDLAGEEAYRFSHILIRDATYALMPKQRRADLHERLARWLERRADAGRGERAELLGHHLEQAFGYRVEVEPAAMDSYAELAKSGGRYLGAAGRAALARDDLPAAVTLLERAVALLPNGDPLRGRLGPELGTGLIEAGRLEDAEGVLAAAEREAVERRDENAEAHAVVAGLVGRLQVDTETVTREVRRRFDALLATFMRDGDDLGMDRLWRLRALVHWIAARSADADAAWERAVEHARRLGDDRAVADSLSWLASSAFVGPTPVPEGIARCEAIREQMRPNLRSQAVVCDSLAGLRAMRGEFEGARGLLAESNSILAELGRTMQSAVSHPEAFVALTCGDPQGAEATLRAGYERLVEMGEKALLSSTAAMLAEALYEQGRLDEAWTFTQVAEATAAGDDLSAQIAWRTERARLLARRGETREAKRINAEAVRLAARTDWLTGHADALRARAEVLTQAGEPREAAAALREAVVLYERKGNTIGARRARAMLPVDVPA
jgi:class 3 adenylate cyclase/tetratricopeptide (TPR) repeat protein